jgi:hypothetical protein
MEGDASLPNYLKHQNKNVTAVTDRDLPLLSYPPFSRLQYATEYAIFLSNIFTINYNARVFVNIF